jgi:hypothetical protein
MSGRVTEELDVLRTRFPDLQYVESGQWILIPRYSFPPGWTAASPEIATQLPPPYPATPPYGIYVHSGIRFRGATPANYAEPASNQPPFGGSWGVFSWSPADGEWRPAADVGRGSNLLNWIVGFADRFREGA